VDALRATADAHRRIMVIEAMGRTAGWIALGAGLASMAEVILIPERPYRKKDLLDYVLSLKASGRRGLVIVVSEAARAEGEDPTVAFHVQESFQKERFGGVAEKLARWIEKESGWEARHVVPGHLQRSRAPTTTDRFLTVAMGVTAAQCAMKGEWNKAVVYRDGIVKTAALSDIQKGARVIPTDHRWVKLVQQLGHFI
jgi:6-phosphofructokinase